jgi:DNA modification methylase
VIRLQKEQLKIFIDPEDTFLSTSEFHSFIEKFRTFGKSTEILKVPGSELHLPFYINEFWTSKQRMAHSLHEISYRACFKPQLPRFFITRLTKKHDIVYDPFMGRGTTIIEAALLGRIPSGCDINPLSKILISPRLNPPELTDICKRLQEINMEKPIDIWEDLNVFYHPITLKAITNLREYLIKKSEDNELDYVDAWIRMVATNRLTGHSTGFFSVYTLPPNQAVSLGSQKRINEKRAQTPPIRDVREIIIRKSKSLLKKIEKHEIEILRNLNDKASIVTGSSDSTPIIKNDSVSLVVTSPPFLDTVDYQADNWLRCWFNGIDASTVHIWHIKKPEEWKDKMTGVFKELKRILSPGGHVAFEVGEVRGGKILLESLVIPAGVEAGLEPCMVIVNSQVFTKTSNCWGVDNLKKGTNTNRIVLLRKSK